MVLFSRAFAVVMALSSVVGLAGSASAQSAGPERLVKQVSLFFNALERGDATAIGPQLAPELVWTSGASGATLDRSQFLSAVTGSTAAGVHFDVDSLRATYYGKVAVVDFVRTDRRPLGSRTYVSRSRVAEVFVRRRNRWQLSRHTQTWLTPPPGSASPDSIDLFPLVGRYEIAPNYIDDIHIDGDHLVATATGQSHGAILVPITRSAFRPDGVGALMVFERDERGRVVGYVQGFPDGNTFRARRLP